MTLTDIIAQENKTQEMLHSYIEELRERIKATTLPGVTSSSSSGLCAVTVSMSSLKYGWAPETYIPVAQANAVCFALQKCKTATDFVERLRLMQHDKAVHHNGTLIRLNPQTLAVLADVLDSHGARAVG